MRKHVLASLAVLAVTLTAGAVVTRAAPVDFVFEPPTLQGLNKAVCARRESDADLGHQWLAWDRAKLPQISAKELSRTMVRLRELDAAKYRQVVERIIELMPQVKNNYGEANALLDRIRLLVAAGQSAEVRDQGLVNKLMALGVTMPSDKNELADLVIQGLSPGNTAEAGLKLKVEAALGGSSTAMLDIVERVEAGEKIAGWQLESPLAVSLAYGSLIGEMDDTVCDRIARIARDYEAGKIVTRNPVNAVKWYQLAADLGDSRSAWKVAQYYLDGEDVPADSELMFKYLNKSVDAGNTAAITALASMYEEGALVERDLNKAIELYDKAAALNDQSAQVKKVKLLARAQQSAPETSELYRKSLSQLTSNSNAPAWATMRLSRQLQAELGFWSAIPQSRQLLEKAAAQDDVEAKIDLAEVLIADNQSAAERRKAIDILARVVKSDGDVRAVENLVRYYRCIEPNAKSETYWLAVKDAMGNDTVDIAVDEVNALSAGADKQKIAALQTQSLYGRGSAIAIFRRYLALQPDSQAMQDFWAKQATATRNGELEEMNATFQSSLKRGLLEQARQAIKPVNAEFNPAVGINFAKFLAENYSNNPEAMELARQILKPLAEKGFGRAIQLLVSLGEGAKASDYTQAMKSRGDMVAQLMLAEQAINTEERQQYLRHATGMQSCDFGDLITFGEYALRLDPGQAERWLEAAIRMANSNHWLEVKVADLYMSAGSEKATQRALEIYRSGHEAQENAASYRLVKFYSDKARKEYNPQMASNIFVDLIQRSELKDVPERLALLKNMKQEIRREVSLRLNVPNLYRRAAEANQPVAMREYGKILRSDQAATKSAESFDWLLRAANLGDAEGMFYVSQSYAFGIGVAPSEDKARLWLVKAADAGFEEAVKLRALITAPPEG